MTFRRLGSDGSARCGILSTEHGDIRTPAFMPVGTQGTVKAVTPRDLGEVGADIILGNTYHLYLRPGTDILEQAGGLHRLIGWSKPILTDSGGFQVYSLTSLRKMSDEGVWFKSHIDGSSHLFTPEKVIDIQRSIGSDIMMVLDECTPYPCDEGYAENSNIQTLRWAERCLVHHSKNTGQYGHSQSLFGIVQGSVYEPIREYSARELIAMGFDGYAIGGLAVGEPAAEMYRIISACTALLPAEKPRYLMGVGTPENLLEGIARGVDMFDCVMPTRNGRNAKLFTSTGAVNITNARYRDDFRPADERCSCYACKNFTRAYLRHLFIAKEILGLMLATVHNLAFYQALMQGARDAIMAGNFAGWKDEQIQRMSQNQQLTTTS